MNFANRILSYIPGYSKRSRIREMERVVKARYATAQTTDSNKNNWTFADRMSARAAYDPAMRLTLRTRSRYLEETNSIYAGMIQTAAAHVVGSGPRLQVLTSNRSLNAEIEKQWANWAEEVNLVEKLYTAVATEWRDGEVFAMRSADYSLSVPLDVLLFEADQVQSPFIGIEPSIEDGVRLARNGKPLEYYFLDHHPGGRWPNVTMNGDWYPADNVCHLMQPSRPGQVRGIPRCAPALDDYALLDRYRLATLEAAESAALFAILITTTGPNIVPAQAVGDPYQTMQLRRNMMTFLADGQSMQQIKPEHPTQNHDSYVMSLLTQIARCSGMPYSLAAGTSRDSNFASAKMDVINTWAPVVRRTQKRTTSQLVKKFFKWFVASLPAVDEIVPHRFDWDNLPVADEGSQAEAAATRLNNGLSTLPIEYGLLGKDFDSSIVQASQAFGVTPAQYKQALFAKLYGPLPQPVSTESPQERLPEDATIEMGVAP
jgi:capsid protein